MTEAITYYLAKDMVPFYTVEKPGFKRLVSVFDKQYDLPSGKYFFQVAVPSLYNNIRDEVAAEISNVEYYSATTDLWSSEGLKPYLSYTIHYIDQWEMKSRCLQTMCLCPRITQVKIHAKCAGSMGIGRMQASMCNY